MQPDTEVKEIISIIPARGNSKGVPGKNIRSLAGKPLIAYSIEVAFKSRYINRVVVSTEDEKITKICKKYGVELIKRPDKLATDKSPVIEVIKHTLEVLKKGHYKPHLLVLLQPTSPLREVETVDLAIEAFLGEFEYYDSLVPLYPVGGKLGVIRKGHYVPWYEPGSRRQDIKPVYRECGTIFLFKPDLVENGIAFGEKIFPFIIENYEESIDIDIFDDFKQAEYFLREKKNG